MCPHFYVLVRGFSNMYIQGLSGHYLLVYNSTNINNTMEGLFSWAYGKEKIRGAERNLPDFFGLCPRCQKNFPEKLSKIVFDIGGGGGEWLRKIPIR